MKSKCDSADISDFEVVAGSQDTAEDFVSCLNDTELETSCVEVDAHNAPAFDNAGWRTAVNDGAWSGTWDKLDHAFLADHVFPMVWKDLSSDELFVAIPGVRPGDVPALLADATLGDNHVIALLRNQSLTAASLVAIHEHDQWASVYGIQAALVRHPHDYCRNHD